MITSPESISIPLLYIELFIMTLVSFLIGYTGAYLSFKNRFKNKIATYLKTINTLKSTIKNLQDDLDRKGDGVFRKDRMDDEYEHLQLRDRAFSDEVTLKKVTKKDYSDLINFNRIGTANATNKNELQKIIGIGPYTEAKLNELGIYTFDQISKLTKEDVEIVTELIKFFPDRIKNDRWVDKAKRLNEQLNEETKALQKKIDYKKSTF